MAQITKRYSLGLDFGTESVRALVVDCDTGLEAAQAVRPYRHGVITEKLPGAHADAPQLPPDFALQHPHDYVEGALAVIREVLRTVPASAITGIGVDFTACTMLPVRADGMPLMELNAFRSNPHAWVKLWKHHAAQPEADRVTALAKERGEPFLKYYSGVLSSEWLLPKCWEIARRAPEVYAATDHFIEAGDWVVQRMTGRFTRNSCAAGYKGMWNAEGGGPSEEFLTALDPALAGLSRKWVRDVVAPGRRAGEVTPAFAEVTGLHAGTPVSAATIDAHSGVAGMGVYREGPMAIIMGTSSCHMVLSRDLKFFEGYAGVVKDGIIPGFYGYESGQAAVGDVFGWFARDFMGADFERLSREAAQLAPGQSGLVALEWLNGNRSVLMNGNLTGMMLGLTLKTRPAEVYRALIEATAFGTRKIIEAYREAGIAVSELAVCGGLVKDPMILQIYADVTGLPLRVAASNQAVALGAAIFGALAAQDGAAGSSATPDVETTVIRMTRPAASTYEPDPRAVAAYDGLYRIYRHAHDHFGREATHVMKTLKEYRK